MKGVEAITRAYKHNWTKREDKKPHRRNLDHQREARGGGGRRGRRARDGATGRRVRGGPPLQAQLPRGQQTIMEFLRK